MASVTASTSANAVAQVATSPAIINALVGALQNNIMEFAWPVF